MPRPGQAHHGRRVTRRDKLLAIAFGALLIFGVWWLLFKTDASSFTVMTPDVYDSISWTSREYKQTYTEVHGVERGRPISVYLGPLAEYEDRVVAAYVRELQILNGDPPYAEATHKEFANAIVVCGVLQDCKDVSHRIADAAKDREARDR